MSNSHDEMIAVIQAQRDGAQIQEWNECHQRWFDIIRDVTFSRRCRIKPATPKPREWWIKKCPSMLDPHAVLIFTSQITAKSTDCPHCEIFHVREVLPDEEGKA